MIEDFGLRSGRFQYGIIISGTSAIRVRDKNETETVCVVILGKITNPLWSSHVTIKQAQIYKKDKK